MLESVAGVSVATAGVRLRSGRRRRWLASVLFAGAASALTLVAATAAVADGAFDRAWIAAFLGVALVGANLAPVISVASGRIDAFTPVGALLVPIGVLLPLPEAVVTYAVAEAVGVVSAHRWDRVIGGPDESAVTRTAFVIGKSIVGAALGLLAMRVVVDLDPDGSEALLAALIGVAVSTAADRTILATVTAVVRSVSLWTELRRGVGGLTIVAASEVLGGALIAVLAARDPWSLVLGVGVLALAVVAGSAYTRARSDRRHTQELLDLAGALQSATASTEVDAALLRTVGRLLPEDAPSLQNDAPPEDGRGWSLEVGDRRRWLVLDRPVDTRDYEQQPVAVVEAAVSLAQVAMQRAQAQERLTEQDRLRALVLSTVAHDLRAPLAVASTAMETLDDRAGAVDEDVRGRLLAAVRRAVGRADRLVDDLLGLELLDERARVTAEAHVETVVRDLLLEFDLEDVRIELDLCDHVVPMDPVSLGRVLENLVRNAAKYSPVDGAVTIRCTSTTAPDGAVGVELTVEDQGPGVALDARAAIFEPFEQAGQGRGGVGLGLYVARRFTELHGGRIWVDGPAQGGAVFHVWLPLPERGAAAGTPRRGTQAP